jgi:outer membrane protein W
MKKLLFSVSVVLLAFAAQRASAQDLPYYSPNPAIFQIRYGIGFPLNGLKDNISNTSYNGLDASLMFPIGQHFSLGLAVEYQDFYQKYPRATYEYGDKSSNVSAVVSNSIQNIPVLLKGTYKFLSPESPIRPYIGAGVGLNAVSYRQYLGEFSNVDQSSGKLALNGEAGVLIPVTRNHHFGIDLAAEYHYLPYNELGIDNLNFWGVKAGIYVPL